MLFDIILILGLLLFVFIGYKVGAIRIILSIASIIGGFIIAITMTGPATNLAVNIGLTDKMEARIESNIRENEKFKQYCDEETGELDNVKVLQALGVPKFLAGIIADVAMKDTDLDGFITKLAMSFTKAIFRVIIFFVLLIFSSLILKILKAILGKTRDSIAPIRVVDGLIGAILITLMFWLLLQIFLAVLSIPIGNGNALWFKEQMHLDDDAKSSLAKYFYTNNVIRGIFSLIF